MMATRAILVGFRCIYCGVVTNRIWECPNCGAPLKDVKDNLVYVEVDEGD